MAKILTFKITTRTILRLAQAEVEKLESIQKDYAAESYRITHGWQFLNQLPEYRQAWEQGDFEL
jgi:hypothetical protein